VSVDDNGDDKNVSTPKNISEACCSAQILELHPFFKADGVIDDRTVLSSATRSNSSPDEELCCDGRILDIMAEAVYPMASTLLLVQEWS
jgi:hypothetical protein